MTFRKKENILPRHAHAHCSVSCLLTTVSPRWLSKKYILGGFLQVFLNMFWHQAAFILLFTSQLKVLNNYLCALDTTFRILNTWYKLHVMNYISYFWEKHLAQAGIDPRRQKEGCYQTTCSTSKPPWLDSFLFCS